MLLLRVPPLVVLAGCTPADLPLPSPPDGPNVLIVLLDDVGVDGIEAYGLSPRPPSTPHLDRLVDEGVRFTRAYAYSVCAPSRAALLTGRYGRRHGYGTNQDFHDESFQLSRSERTFAEMAAERGYRTGAFGKWHLTTRNRAAEHPNRSGFQTFEGLLGNFGDVLGNYGKADLDYSRWERNRNGDVELISAYAPSVVVDDALAWVAEQTTPWLAYVAMPTAHGPMHVPPADLHTTDVDEDSSSPELFRAVVEAGDTELGRLLEGIDPDVLEDTVIILAGDNGTDDGRDAVGFNVLGGKVSVFEGGIRVPLVVWGAGGPAGSSHDGLVHLVDVFPTVAALIDGDLGTAVLDGRDLLPWVEEPDRQDGREVVYTEFFGPVGRGPYRNDRRVLVGRDYKLIDVQQNDEIIFTSVGPSPEDEARIEVEDATVQEQAVLTELQARLAQILADLEG